MSSNNDNGAGSGAAIGFAFLGVAGLFIFAVLAFLACILTALSIIILVRNKPLRIGKATAGPKEARAFLIGGVLGTAILPVFAAFCAAIYDFNINWDYLPQIMGFGYVFGSITLDLIMTESESDAPSAPYIPPQPQLPAPTKRPLFYDQADPFRFASWDDEEKRK